MATNQYGFEEERFEQSVSKNFQCIICTNVLREPVMCRNNQHLFCQACICKHLENSQKCPTCMHDLSVDTLCEAPRAITNFLSELKIRCDFYGRGCLMLVELENLEKHVEECGFAPAVCSNEGCQLVVNKRDLIHHKTAVCEQRRVKCHDCADLRHEMDTVKDMLAQMNENLSEIKIQLESMTERFSKGNDRTNTKRKVVAAGGYNSELGELNSAEMFDVSKGTWSYLQPMNEFRESASAFVYNNQIIVAGGCNQLLPMNSMEAIANANQVTPLLTWKIIRAKLPGEISSFCTVVYNDSLRVIGGYDEGAGGASANISEVFLVHPFTIKTLSKMPRKISLHGAEIFDDKIIIVGGFTSKTINNVLMYDIKKNNCEELAPLPYPVKRMASVRWADNIVVIGGNNDDFSAINTVIVYNVETQQSNMLPPMKYKRADCSAVVVDNSIIVMGGQDDNGNTLKSVERFSFNSYTWEELSSMHEKRECHVSVAC